MCRVNSESISHMFLHYLVADFLWNTLFGIFGECWVCPATLDQFLLTSFIGLGKGRRPNLCGNVLHMLLFQVFSWSIILAHSMTDFQISMFCGIELGV